MLSNEIEGFSCSLGILWGGLVINKLQFWIKKIKKKFPVVNFFQFLVIKTLDPDPDPQLGKCWIRIRIGSTLNQCGSTTLP
jgi:hypothetical protein